MAQKNLTRKTRILCIIANDAKIVDKKYVAPGINYQVREKDATIWVENFLPTAPLIWAFGAGTTPECRFGPTYASVCEASLRLVLPKATVIANRDESWYWGTYEEMAWIVGAVGQKYEPTSVQFVFFTQPQHMERVQLVWRLFFEKEWGEARFVPTGHAEGCDLRDSNEWKKRVAYRMMRYSFGLFKPKHRRPNWTLRYAK